MARPAAAPRARWRIRYGSPRRRGRRGTSKPWDRRPPRRSRRRASRRRRMQGARSSQGPFHAQRAHAGGVDAQQLAVDLLVMLAEAGSPSPLAPWRLREEERRSGVDERLAEILVNHAHPVVARRELLALDDLAGA